MSTNQPPRYARQQVDEYYELLRAYSRLSTPDGFARRPEPKHGAIDMVCYRGVWMIPEDRARYGLQRSD
jgi:hypothetical protein